MPESVGISINGRRIKHFTGFSFTKSIDHVGDEFVFECPFYPATPIYREIFRPFKYQDVTIHIGGSLQLTGRVEKITPMLSGNKSIVRVQGRSKPGVIVDCSFEKDVFPLQHTGAALDEIADKTLLGYDFKAVFEDEPGAIFEEAGAQSPSETIFNFLHNLARQRKLLMSQTVEGNLLFRRATTLGPVGSRLEEGKQNLVITTGSYDGSKRFSTFDVFGQEPGANDNYAQVVDAAIQSRRPKSAVANDNNSANITESAGWLASSSLADAVNIPLTTVGWLKPSGQLWRENELTSIYAPSIMIYKPFIFLIRSVTFTQNDTENITNLSLTVPGAYSGVLPEAYPWE